VQRAILACDDKLRPTLVIDLVTFLTTRIASFSVTEMVQNLHVDSLDDAQHTATTGDNINCIFMAYLVSQWFNVFTSKLH